MSESNRLRITESWLAQMSETRQAAVRVARRAAALARETHGLLRQISGDDPPAGELASSADSAEAWAAHAEKNPTGESLATYFETIQNCLNEAVWILDNARAGVRKQRPDLLD